MRSSRGFTLVELMIVVSIIAFLAALAIPQYNSYIRRGYAAEAVSLLGTFRVRMETYFQDNRNYGSSTCGVAVPTNPRFVYACTVTSGGQAYAVTATGNGGVVLGSTYQVDQSGAQTTTSFKGATVSKNCWLIRGNEC